MPAVKQILKNMPFIGPALEKTVHLVRQPLRNFNSAQYWQDRYRDGGNSGAGSYGRLAQFKAEILNNFVQKHHVQSVIEFGCGDGAQLGLAQYPQYTGVDVSPKAVELCRQKYGNDPSKSFFTLDNLPPRSNAELALSLDVIYHLVEDHVFHEYMNWLFASATRFVIIYASNKNETWPVTHVRHRKFTDWIVANQPNWPLRELIKNKYPYDPANPDDTSFADFYIFEHSQN